VYCSTCGDEREFEQPPCPDGHGPDCPERACTACGTAVLVGLPLTAASAANAAPGARAAATATAARPSPTDVSDAPGSARAASELAVA
jgi:hypothetical protein